MGVFFAGILFALGHHFHYLRLDKATCLLG